MSGADLHPYKACCPLGRRAEGELEVKSVDNVAVKQRIKKDGVGEDEESAC